MSDRPSARTSRLLSLPTEILELIVCRLESPDLLATILSCRQLMTIAGPLLLRHVTLRSQLWSSRNFAWYLERNPERASSVVSYTERVLKWEKYPMGPQNSPIYIIHHTMLFLPSVEHLSICVPAGLFWNWLPDLAPAILYERYEFPRLKTLHLEYWYRTRLRPTISRGLSCILPQPNLEQITLCNMILPIFWTQPRYPPFISSMPLKVLRLVDCDMDPGYLEYLLSATDRLKYLEISTRWCRRNLPHYRGATSNQEWAEAMSSAKGTLTTMCLPDLYTKYFVHKTGGPQQISFHQFTATIYLAINIKQVLGKCKDKERLAKAFPPNLQFLKFWSWDTYSESPDRHHLRRLARLLEDGECLKRLRRIEIYTAEIHTPLHYICPRLVLACKHRKIALTTFRPRVAPLEPHDDKACNCRYCGPDQHDTPSVGITLGP